MATFTFGRIGANGATDHVALEFIDRWRTRAGSRGVTDTIRGEAQSDTKADILALINELKESRGQFVAVTFDEYTRGSQFYLCTDVSIDIDETSFADTSAFTVQFDIDVEEIGTAQAVKLLSLIDGVPVANDYGLLEAQVKYTWAPAQSAEAVTDAGAPTGHTRTTVDGSIEVYIDVDKTKDPTWSVNPEDYYKGAARIELGGYTRVGKDAPEDLTSWKISTGIVDVFADGTNDGVINLQHSVDQTPFGFQIKYAQTTAIPAWNYPSIEYNTPELCVLSITRDANESPPTDHLHFLELTARRGMPFIYGRFVWTAETDLVAWSIDREQTDAAGTVTPAGASGIMGIEDAADDADGNRWFLVSPDTTTQDTTNGGLDWDAPASAPTELHFILGMEINGSSANSNDTSASVSLQAFAWLGELVRPSRR